jgi:hypothetical protein
LPPVNTPVEAALETFRAEPNQDTLNRVIGESHHQSKQEYEAIVNEMSLAIDEELARIENDGPEVSPTYTPPVRQTMSTPVGDLIREYANDERWVDNFGIIPVRSRSDWASLRTNARLAVERLDPDALVVSITNFVESHPRAASNQVQRLYNNYRSLMRELAERQGTPIDDDLLPNLNILCPGVN